MACLMGDNLVVFQIKNLLYVNPGGNSGLPSIGVRGPMWDDILYIYEFHA